MSFVIAKCSPFAMEALELSPSVMELSPLSDPESSDSIIILKIVAENDLHGGQRSNDIFKMGVSKSISIRDLKTMIKAEFQSRNIVIPSPQLLFLRGYGKISKLNAPLSSYTNKKRGAIFVLQDVLSFNKV